MVAQSLKTQSIICCLIGIITLFIWNLVVGIRLCVHNDEFENKGLAIAVGIIQIILGGGIIVGLILSCLLKPKTTNTQVAA